MRIPINALRFKAPIAAGLNPFTLLGLVPLLRNTSQDHDPILVGTPCPTCGTRTVLDGRHPMDRLRHRRQSGPARRRTNLGRPHMARHTAPTHTGRKATIVTGVTAALLAIGGIAAADPAPPTEGGNGAGSSGQCTGAASARPTACQSPGGVSE